MQGIIALLGVALLGTTAVNGEYLFTMGRTIKAGEDVEACLHLKDFLVDEVGPSGQYMVMTTISFKLRYYTQNTNNTGPMENVYSVFSNKPDIYECWSVMAPLTVRYAVDTYTARVVATVAYMDKDGNQVEDNVFNTTSEVKVYQSEWITLIQTDKPIYKPGQTVKFRVMTLDENFIVDTNGYSQITIESPSGMRIKQWDTVKAPKGIVSLKMPLSSDPLLGTYSIKVDTGAANPEMQTFKVDEYVLPKFEVTVEPPTYLLPSTSKITGRVCAKYTYGKPVKGQLEMEVCYKSSYHGGLNRPCTQILEDIDGCFSFYVDSNDIQLGNKSYSRYGNLEIKAKVTEDGTGIELSGESSGPSLTEIPLTITIEDDMDAFFKPGFPYKGRVIVKNPDKTPAIGEEIAVAANYWNEKKFEKIFRTDEDGIVHFVINDLEADVGELTVEAWSTTYNRTSRGYWPYWRYPVWVSEASRQVRQWYSPSKSYIYIPETEETLDVDSEHVLDVFYTTLPTEEHEFVVTVMSGDHVVKRYMTEHMYDGSMIDLNILSVQPSQVLDKYIPPPTEAPPEEETSMPPIVYEEEIVPETYVPLTSEARVKRAAGGNSVIAYFKLAINVTFDLNPEAKILLYYIRSDGEIVAATTKFNVKKTFKNQASMEFSKDTARPGEKLTMSLEASAESTCFVGMVDKSVNLLGGKGSMLSPEEVYNSVRKNGVRNFYHSNWAEDEAHCEKDKEELRKGNEYYYISVTPEGADASTAFRDASMWVVTDGVYMSRPCVQQERYPVYYMRTGGGSGRRNGPISPAIGRADDSNDPEINIRSFFPETWLWDVYEISKNGKVSVTTKMPDTITEWVGNSLCTHPTDGLGVSPVVGVTAFQPFFVSITMPYSAVRGEMLPLKVTVFSYLENCLSMELKLEETDGMRITSPGGTSRQFCLCGGESETSTFFIVPTVIGEVDIEAIAWSVQGNGVCNNVILSTVGMDVSDGVQRQLLVEAEGVPQDMTTSSFVCLKAGENVMEKQDLLFPEDLVQGSERATVSVIGDIMGPTLTNLKNLLRMPYGCGEQNMASWSPNVYVLQYLKSTKQATKKLKAEAKNYMTNGYQRQMNYRHHDYSYSAFGDNSYMNATGSLWLTTFVIKTMAQSAKFVHVNPQDIEKSANWLFSHQQRDGCFPQVGLVFSSYMKGGLADGDNPAGLTAFVLIALLEANLEKAKIKKGFKCLDKFDLDEVDTYTLAIMAYAYTLYDRQSQRRQNILSMLETKKQTDVPGQMYWKREDEENLVYPGWCWMRAPGAQVEMTAYVLLAKLADGKNNFVELQSIVQWLTRQRNPYGGFSSTQDTVVAIQALAEFAKLTYSSDNSSLVITAETKKSKHEFKVTNENSLLFQSKQFNAKDGLIETSFAGSGCAMLQVNLKYNIYKDLDVGQAFDVKVSPFRSSIAPRQCSQRSLKICISYRKPGGISNMAIAEVKMLTGWEPVVATLKTLRTSGAIQKYEIDKNYVQLYFDQLTKDRTCIDFDVKQEIRMNTKAAKVRVYDYYEADYTVTVPYEIKTTCGTKEEIPFDNKGIDCSIMQCRVTNAPKAKKTVCPSCPSTLPDDTELEKLVCDSEVVYKTVVGRRRRKYPMKVKANIKPRKKEILDLFVKPKMSKPCDCPTLFPAKESKVLIFTKSYVLVKQTEELVIGDETVVHPVSKTFEKKVRRKTKICKKLARQRRKALLKRLMAEE